MCKNYSYCAFVMDETYARSLLFLPMELLFKLLMLLWLLMPMLFLVEFVFFLKDKPLL